VFELISAMVRYFADGIKSDAASAIGFARFASSGCDIDLIVNDFPTVRIIKWLVWLSNIGKGS